MKTLSCLLLWALIALRSSALAQTEKDQAKKTVPPALLELQNARKQLAADFREFSTAHAADAPEARRLAMEAFHRKNLGLTEDLRVKAAALAQATPTHEIPMIRSIPIPDDASPAMEELLVLRAQMANQRAAVLNATRGATPEQAALAMRESEKKNQALSESLRQQSLVVAAEARLKPVPVPPPVRIPAGATPELRNAVLQHYARMKQSIEKENEIRSLPQDQQEAARKASRPSLQNKRDPLSIPRKDTHSDSKP